jgi:prefoldin subunit 5
MVDLVRHGFYDFDIPRAMYDDIEHLRAQVTSLQKELAERTAERDEALSEVDDLQPQAEVVAEEFEKDCWKAMRSLLSSCNFNWQDVEDGVTADDAREYISTTLDELEKGEQRWKARADTLARRVEVLEAALRSYRRATSRTTYPNEHPIWEAVRLADAALTGDRP